LGLNGIIWVQKNGIFWMNSFPLNVIRTLEFPVSLLHQSIDIDGFGGLMILNPFGSS